MNPSDQHAPSGSSARDTTSRDLGEDTIALISALGAERAHLVGHDWGAEAVYAAVGLAPERVITLTAIGCPARRSASPATTSPSSSC
jgi:pimeloyl-ACP methyl ester carboxylesterase